VCVGEIISLPWFSKELKTTYRRTTAFVESSLYFSFANRYLLGGGFPFLTVLVPRYTLFFCHTPIKPDLLGFPGIDVFACRLRDYLITRFASGCLTDISLCSLMMIPNTDAKLNALLVRKNLEEEEK